MNVYFESLVANQDSSWNDRIPFVLLFGIATSIDLFQEKLSRTTIRCLQGVKFDMEQLAVDEILKAAVSLNEPRLLWPGSGLSSTMVQRQNDYFQSTSSFVEVIKVTKYNPVDEEQAKKL